MPFRQPPALERVELIINENLPAIKQNIPDIAEGPYYMGVSGVTLRFSAKCPEIMKFQVERDLNRQIKLIFDKNNINIPFTQIVVHKAKTLSKEKMADAQAAQKFMDEQRNLSRGMDEDEGNQ